MQPKAPARLFDSFAKTLGRQVWSAALQLGTVVVVARAYGPAGNGLFTVAMLLPTMLSTLISLGIAPANTYFIASGAYSLRAVARTTLYSWLWLSIIGTSIGGAFIVLRADEYFPGIPPSSLWVALLCFPPLLFVSFAGSLFQGLQDFTSFNLSLSALPAFTLLGIIACVLFSLGSESLLAASLLGAVSAALVMLILMVKRLGREPVAQDRYPMRVALEYGLKSHLSNVIVFVNYRVNLFLVNFLINPAAAGIYAVAMQISERLWVLSHAVSTVALPRLASMKDEDARAVLTPLLSRLLALVTLLGAIFIALIAYPFIKVVFGTEFAASFVPLLLLMPGIVAGAPARVLANDIAARGRPEVNMYTAIFTAVVNIAANVILIPMIGLNGAAIATSLAYSANLVLRVILYRRLAGSAASDLLLFKIQDFGTLKRAIWQRKAAKLEPRAP